MKNPRHCGSPSARRSAPVRSYIETTVTSEDLQKHLAALKDDPAAQRLYQLLADRTKLLARKKKEEAA